MVVSAKPKKRRTLASFDTYGCGELVAVRGDSRWIVFGRHQHQWRPAAVDMRPRLAPDRRILVAAVIKRRACVIAIDAADQNGAGEPVTRRIDRAIECVGRNHRRPGGVADQNDTLGIAAIMRGILLEPSDRRTDIE